MLVATWSRRDANEDFQEKKRGSILNVGDFRLWGPRKIIRFCGEEEPQRCKRRLSRKKRGSILEVGVHIACGDEATHSDAIEAFQTRVLRLKNSLFYRDFLRFLQKSMTGFKGMRDRDQNK